MFLDDDDRENEEEELRGRIAYHLDKKQRFDLSGRLYGVPLSELRRMANMEVAAIAKHLDQLGF